MTNPNQPTKFTYGSAQQIAEATRLVLNEPRDLRGRRRQSPSVGTDYGAGLKYQVLMTIDDAGTVGWDYPRMH